MYCKHCGKEIDDNSQFCKFCGKKLVDTQNISIEFTKPKFIGHFQSYFKKILGYILPYLEKLYKKYRLFFSIMKKDEMKWFYPLIAIIFLVWIFFLTFALLGGIFHLLSINTNDIPYSYGIALGTIISILLFNRFVTIYNKYGQQQ